MSRVTPQAAPASRADVQREVEIAYYALINKHPGQKLRQSVVQDRIQWLVNTVHRTADLDLRAELATLVEQAFTLGLRLHRTDPFLRNHEHNMYVLRTLALLLRTHLSQ